MRVGGPKVEHQAGKEAPAPQPSLDLSHQQEAAPIALDGPSPEEAAEIMLDGMAKAFHVSAWANAFEESRKSFPPRTRIDQVAPPTSQEAREHAEKVVQEIVALNQGASLYDLALRAVAADPKINLTHEIAHELGWYMGMQALGHGVSWTDNHPGFGLNLPHTEFCPDFAPEDLSLDRETGPARPLPLAQFRPGQLVHINMQAVWNANRSIHAMPSNSFVQSLKEQVAKHGPVGVVTHTFPPAYELTVQVGEKAFHMKGHNWATPLADHEQAIFLPDARGRKVMVVTPENRREIEEALNAVPTKGSVPNGHCYPVGEVAIFKPFEHRTNMETAAWYAINEVKPQLAEVVRRHWPGGRDSEPFAQAEATNKVHHTPSLLGGAQVGDWDDQAQAGQRTQVLLSVYPGNAIPDGSVVFIGLPEDHDKNPIL